MHSSSSGSAHPSAAREVRAFLAIPIPAELQEPIRQLQHRMAERFPDLRWVRPANLHLTLKFFAAVTEEQLEKIGDIMLSVGRLQTPFQVRLAGVGVFPHPARARVVWLGIEGAEPLNELFLAIDRELQQIGIPREERPFSPHLTLARCRQPLVSAASALEPFRHTVCGTLPVERIVLYQSQLRPGGAIHRPLKIVDLGRPVSGGNGPGHQHIPN